MMRSKPSSSMQKTYDECYLLCSTAAYFEGQNNEPEALRSWKSALDTIHYHNAHRVPTTYIPKTDGERALQESIRELELQCKERVDLLEALRQSRRDAGVDSEPTILSSKGKLEKARPQAVSSKSNNGSTSPGWIGDGTIPSSSYPELMKAPSLPPRPSISGRNSGESIRQSSRDFLNSMRSGPTPRPLPSPPPFPSPSSKMPQQRQHSPERKKLLTTLRGKEPKSSSIFSSSAPNRPSKPAASKAAGLAWNSGSASSSSALPHSSSVNDLSPRKSISNDSAPRKDAVLKTSSSEESPGAKQSSYRGDYFGMAPARRRISNDHATNLAVGAAAAAAHRPVEIDSYTDGSFSRAADTGNTFYNRQRRMVSRPKPEVPSRGGASDWTNSNDPPSYHQAMSSTGTTSKEGASDSAKQSRAPKANPTSQPRPRDVEPIGIPGPSSRERARNTSNGASNNASPARQPQKARSQPVSKPSPEPSDNTTPEENGLPAESELDQKIKSVMESLPKGIDVQAARQIVNEIVVRGDEVHWDDVAGLETAKKALKEAVVYPFLRPDLFMGLREPARGMLLFGPPGTGKTMLARAVATESHSTFFSVSASSLTSKWHGESEKLVRALFALAKALAPSIIFVDEIDSLLSSRSQGGEVEASRRSKTEFLIQWSDLQRAAAGREQSEQEKKIGDASRVLVLAATNMPWDIDEAARRRFVRRQYIPLPEAEVRKLQFQKLLSHQTHELSDEDLEVLVQATEGFSGSDITSLAKDAAMGPLRNLGEDLLQTPMDQIPPIRCKDFEASLLSIRPSVGREGLKQYEEWAKEFGERGG